MPVREHVQRPAVGERAGVRLLPGGTDDGFLFVKADGIGAIMV